MITIAHLMDDFGMGGVTRALTVFDEPALTREARSQVVPIEKSTRIAPRLEVDLIVDHATLCWARLPFLLSLRARNPQARIVHVEHSYTRAFEQGEVRAKARFRAMLRTAARLFDDIICVSEAQRQWLSGEVGIAGQKLRVIFPWTDRTELFSVLPANPQANAPVRLLAYGRYAPVKNFAALICAMRAIDPGDAHLTVFGDGPERAALEALAADLPHVEIHGPCPDPAGYLAQCDAVIVPSRYEAFGLVATEARMAARPVIAANVDGLPEQAAKAGCAVAMGTAQEIAQAIRWAIRTDLQPLGLAARRGVELQQTCILAGWSDLINEVATAGRLRNSVATGAGRAEMAA